MKHEIILNVDSKKRVPPMGGKSEGELNSKKVVRTQNLYIREVLHDRFADGGIVRA